MHFDLGVEVGRVRMVFFLVASLLVGSSVRQVDRWATSVLWCHISPGSHSEATTGSVPAAALGGALFVIVADTVARTVIAPRELPVGQSQRSSVRRCLSILVKGRQPKLKEDLLEGETIVRSP